MLAVERITVFCFAASYAVAFGLELLYQFRPRPIFRLVSLGFGTAGLLAHTLFVLVQPLLLASPFGSLIFLGWILAVFYLYGSLHHGKVAWGLFVLPVVLGVTGLATVSAAEPDPAAALRSWETFRGERFWGQVHGVLVLLAAVGVSVGFLASLMYLIQVSRLKAKTLPGRGMKLLSLERLETMNRRAVTWAFPLLTVGLLVGVFLALHGRESFVRWDNPKLLTIVGLWVVFAILLYLRYGAHAGGRQVAVWTIVAFALMLLSLLSPVHPLVSGVVP